MIHQQLLRLWAMVSWRTLLRLKRLAQLRRQIFKNPSECGAACNQLCLPFLS